MSEIFLNRGGEMNEDLKVHVKVKCVWFNFS